LGPDFREELIGMMARLARFAVALTRSRHEAEDLVQMTCERALTHAQQWRVDTRLDSWLFRIMQTIWFNELRSRAARNRWHTEAHRTHDLAMDGERLAVTRLMLREVAQTIFQFSEADRAVLVLVCVEGLTYRETAEILDIPIGTVMSRLARARLTLEQKLRTGNGGPGSVNKLVSDGDA
jgi:RNA polymerase sigma-70 factor (ECF subfamily)